MIITRKEQGSAAVISIAVAVMIIIGALGFLVWKNFLAPNNDSSKTTTQSTQAKSKPATGNLRYETDRYSFEYPKDGWRLVEQRFGVEGDDTITPVVKTLDWAQSSMAIETGAEVSINASPATRPLSEMKTSTASFAESAAKDTVDTKVDGVDAFSYTMSYEGEYYSTVVIYDGIAYIIKYQHAYGDKPTLHMDGYNTIVSTFKFKR